MSSDWQYTGNNIIKRIYCKVSYDTCPTKYSWFVLLENDLNVPLNHDSINSLKLNDKEKEALVNARANAIELNKNESTLMNDYSIFSLSNSKKISNEFFNFEK
jgi:hypothetical protein